MNAAILAHGYDEGGAEGARAALKNFWSKVAEAARFSPFQRGPMDILLGRWTLDHSPLYLAADLLARFVSPYSLSSGPNPLRDVLVQCIDFDRLPRSPIKLFITATNVRTGQGRVFRNNEITPDVLLASACLPTMFQAIEINGDEYWDGGYTGNPTITPLVRECDIAGYDPDSDQSGGTEGSAALGARHHQSSQRNLLQWRAVEGVAHDCAAAADRQPRPYGRRAVGDDADSPHRQQNLG